MENGYGSLLRMLRNQRGFSLGRLAMLAQVDKATLSRWEAGVHQPRLPELETTLTALDATPEERRRVFATLHAPRATRRLRALTWNDDLEELLGPRPGGGDLLRAIRLRRGFTLEQAASRVAVQSRTVRRWENGETWPGGKTLHALCEILEASDAERQVLQRGRGALPQGDKEETGRDAVSGRWQAEEGSEPSQPPGSDLEFLALEAQMWPLAARQSQTWTRLSELYTRHAEFLDRQGRKNEARRYAARACALTLAASRSAMPRVRASNSGRALPPPLSSSQ